MIDKTADAMHMLWSSFSSREQVVFYFCAVGVLVAFYVMGHADGNAREREREKMGELADLIAERLK